MSHGPIRPRAGPSPRAEVPSRRRRRADAGKFRLDPHLQNKLSELFSKDEPLRMGVVERELRDFCRGSGLRMPSRAALYTARWLIPLKPYRKAGLPEAVRDSLYNLDDDALVPGEQLAFYAFNYGTTAALSFAAGLPLLCLERAERLAGWRPKSLSLLRCVIGRRRSARA